ncbi:MAG: hypothetical protein QNJ45_09415 [Ardenticatenaceae bacterium]|nr:hypothetical protein [Ardenticatenaceae bacterium]
MTESQPHDINVEKIMADIRQQIALEEDKSADLTSWLAAFQVKLALIDEANQQMQVLPVPQQSGVPIFGWFIDKARSALHGLIVFYTNQMAAKQIRVNREVLAALNQLGQEVARLESYERNRDNK